MPYYLAIQLKEQEFINNQTSVNNELFILVPPEFDPLPTLEAHATFDRLSGKNHQDGEPDDVISQKVIDRLKSKLDTCQVVRDFVDKFVAHSATPASRAAENITKSQVTWKHMWDAHQTVYEVSEFLSSTLYSEGHFPLPWNPPGLLNHWGVPFLNTLKINQLEEAFQRYRKETERWQLEAVERTWSWIEQ